MLGLASLMGMTGVLLTPKTLPGPRRELQAAVVTVAGVDLPVSAALAGGDPIPDRSSRLRRQCAGQAEAEAQSEASQNSDEALGEDRGHERRPFLTCACKGVPARSPSEDWRSSPSPSLRPRRSRQGVRPAKLGVANARPQGACPMPLSHSPSRRRTPLITNEKRSRDSP